MINNDSNTLSLIKEIASRIIPNSMILLFGSRARKDNSKDSEEEINSKKEITGHILKQVLKEGVVL